MQYNGVSNCLNCECLHFRFSGYSCCHSIAVVVKQSLPPSDVPIHKRWLLLIEFSKNKILFLIKRLIEENKSENLDNTQIEVV